MSSNTIFDNTEKLRHLLGLAEPSDTTLLDAAMKFANSTIEGRTGRKLVAEDADETVIVDGSARRALLLPLYPVQSIAAVYEGPSLVSNAWDWGTAIDSYKYRVRDEDRERGLIYRTQGCWPEGHHNVRIDGRFGYWRDEDHRTAEGSATDLVLPEELRTLALEAVAFYMDNQTRGHIAVQSRSNQGVVQTMETKFWSVGDRAERAGVWADPA